MTGFDNGTLWNGVFFQAKQFGSILRGFGPPVPDGGVVGDLYLDVQTFFLYGKRGEGIADPWGNYLFQVPLAYQSTLKLFGATAPTNDIGAIGDYFLLWAGWSNYGLQPLIYGPKTISGWAENGDGLNTLLDPLYAGFALPVGLVDEGAAVGYSSSTQLIVAGLVDEYILAIPVSDAGGTPISQLGVQSLPALVAVVLNPIYTTENQHVV